MKRNDKAEALASFEVMGMASLIPGMQYMLERMQAELDDLKERLLGMQNGVSQTETPKRRGRPPKVQQEAMLTAGEKIAAAVRQRWADATPEERKAHGAMMAQARMAKQAKSSVVGGWSKYTPEERKAEMARRMEVARQKRAAAEKQAKRAAKKAARAEAVAA